MSLARKQRRLQKKAGTPRRLHKPNDSKTASALQATMEALVEFYPGCHVTLLISPMNPETGKHDQVNYISTANRDEMIAVMKEFIERQDEIPESLSAINDSPPTGTPQ